MFKNTIGLYSYDLPIDTIELIIDILKAHSIAIDNINPNIDSNTYFEELVSICAQYNQIYIIIVDSNNIFGYYENALSRINKQNITTFFAKDTYNPFLQTIPSFHWDSYKSLTEFILAYALNYQAPSIPKSTSNILIDEFMKRYVKEYDFYEIVSKLVADKLEKDLSSYGIRAITTYRAKNPERLKEKLLKRNKDNRYQSLDDIYNDIYDFSGVRVALYFPNDKDKVEQVIIKNFNLLQEPKVFPNQEKAVTNSENRFSGYWAKHYRVTINEKDLNTSQIRYSNSKVEIQVASVLMHAWSEVEHDLLYKPLNGEPSKEERAILDELNGLVLAGDIALERLQDAVNIRLNRDKTINNQYELGTFLLNKFHNKIESNSFVKLGNVELLFTFMNACNILSISDLSPFLKLGKFEDDTRTLCEIISDNIIGEDKQKLNIYSNLQSSLYDHNYKLQKALNSFMDNWILLEKLINTKSSNLRNNNNHNHFSTTNLMKLFSSEDVSEILKIRDYRNSLVHGAFSPNIDDVKRMTEEIKIIFKKIDNNQ